ncbi:hypothetical protein Ga0466249_002276 [Sporomusaceae bacterium BoRhaA]|uniref:hypothetical protein n=1 Tax=Pelorhabdus rhamnosifermentans TaxID=2772457 RepID=UPI001C05F834|nr:hypothetical protein [Pelorhabdus rhamnosifermentans]MBU2701162.1 hypothetical protein [Pelorhabdus rhamnosifermentans]
MSEKTLEGRVRTTDESCFILGSDGYFDNLLFIMKQIDGKTVRVSIEVIEDSII